MEFLNSPFAGPAILLVAVVVLCIYIAGKTKRDYAAAMKKYEEGMAAYQAAVEASSGTPVSYTHLRAGGSWKSCSL